MMMVDGIEMAIFHTGGVFSYLPHHLDLALEDSVGHSTCMSECVGASQGYHGVVGGLGLGLGLAVGWLVGSWRWGKYVFAPPVCGFRCTRGST